MCSTKAINVTSDRQGPRAVLSFSRDLEFATLMALSSGFGRETSGLTITSHGWTHRITLRVTRLAGRIKLERSPTPAPRAGLPARVSTVRVLLQPGRGPHAAQLRCGSCNSFIKWVSKVDVDLLLEQAVDEAPRRAGEAK
jgi:hypothetical protein